MSALLTAFAATISAFLALFAIYFSWRANTRSIHFEWLRETLEWSHECVDNLAELAVLCVAEGLSADYVATRKYELMAKLSSLIDRGRIFFVNEKNTSHGSEKEPAYQGFAPMIIEILKASYSYAEMIDHSDTDKCADLHDKLVKARRMFVSILQEQNPDFVHRAREYARDEPIPTKTEAAPAESTQEKSPGD